MNEKIIDTFHIDKPIIGMLHLNGFTQENVHDLAKREIETMYANGVDAVLVENYYGTADDCAWALEYLSSQYSGKIYGVNILGNSELAFSLAREYNAAFIQIDSVCGHLTQKQDEIFSRKLAGLRKNSSAFLLGGVRFKYQPVKSGRTVEEDLLIGKYRCNAVVVTGAATGESTDIKKIKLFREVLGNFPLIVGAGMNDENCREQISIADGAIVGTYFKQNGETHNPIDPERVKRLMAIVKEVR
ncbi:MAG: hypothetical protein IJU48_03890 [Synergistaceae bacterium]|nr:hypothetical protein [Synergistaceae bacterium]